MNSEISRAGYEVLQRLVFAGFDAWVVGGAVRDKYLQREIRDVDLLTAAALEDIKNLFQNVHTVGAGHETVLVIFNQTAVEVSVVQTATLEADLARRDFTINAMAETLDGSIIDPLQGRVDLASKTIRSCAADGTNFERDPLRMLRAYRLAIELSFYIADETLELIQSRQTLITLPAPERIAAEFEKIARSLPGPPEWALFFNSPVFRHLPNVFRDKSFISLLQTQSLPSEGNVLLHWWAAASYTPEMDKAAETLTYYRRSNQLKKDTAEVFQFLTLSSPSSYHLYQLGEKRLQTVCFLYTCLHGTNSASEKWKTDYEALPIKNRKQLSLDGKMILQEAPSISGNQIGELLEAAEKLVVTRTLPNEPTALRAWIRSQIE